MLRRTILTVSLTAISYSLAFAADLPDWVTEVTNNLKNNSSAAPADAAEAPNVPSAAPAASKESNKRSVINTSHSLDEIAYKISRAHDNLNGYTDDLGGRKQVIMEYLQKALEELKAVKQ